MAVIEYDSYKQKLLAMSDTFANLEKALDIEASKHEIARLEAEAHEEGFWNDIERSQANQMRTKQLQNKLHCFEKLVSARDDLLALIDMGNEMDDASLLPELQEGYDDLEKRIEEVRLTTLLSGEYDNCNAILTFHAGAGGTEAQDWTQMLYRMYMQWANKHGFEFEMMDYIDGEEAGIKSATVMVKGENAYGYLKGENGVHRLVRVSPFDANARRQTSFAALEVMPELPNDIEVDIRPEDIEMQVYRSSGAGGQHVNKTSSAVRLIHIPTGIVTACQTQRSQFQNRDYAMQMLKSKLMELKIQQHAEKISDLKGVQLKIEWGSQIRSYVFMPYQLVKDTRTDYETGNIQAVMDGDLDGFINAYLTKAANGELKK
ncbi:peptide chain release factor 2 [Oscillibacter valericigenes]|nr:peptide chain release factor 2 [Oscillibacter valericigenes]